MTPPHDEQAEAAVLGAVMQSATALTEVAPLLAGEDFYLPRHEMIWDAITALADAGEGVDPITVGDCMRRAGTLDRAGGQVLLFDLIAAVPTVSNVGYYARIVREQAGLRRLLTAATRITQTATGTDGTAEDVAAIAMSELTAAVRPAADAEPTIAEQVEEALSAMEDTSTAGWSWPWTDLNRVMIPPTPGQFILVAARPGVGKTVTLVDIARHVALRHGLPVTFHTVEMPAVELVHRIISAEERIPLSHIKRGELTQDEWTRVAHASQRIIESGLKIIPEREKSSIPGIRAAIEKHRPAVVLLDYFQIAKTDPTTRDRRQALEEMSRDMKALAKDQRVPIIAAAQLNRESVKRDGPPMLSEMRETGALEQDCDAAILLHRPDATEPECDRAGEVDLLIAKQRNGPTGRATLVHQLHYSRFVDMAA